MSEKTGSAGPPNGKSRIIKMKIMSLSLFILTATLGCVIQRPPAVNILDAAPEQKEVIATYQGPKNPKLQPGTIPLKPSTGGPINPRCKYTANAMVISQDSGMAQYGRINDSIWYEFNTHIALFGEKERYSIQGTEFVKWKPQWVYNGVPRIFDYWKVSVRRDEFENLLICEISKGFLSIILIDNGQIRIVAGSNHYPGTSGQIKTDGELLNLSETHQSLEQLMNASQIMTRYQEWPYRAYIDGTINSSGLREAINFSKWVLKGHPSLFK